MKLFIQSVQCLLVILLLFVKTAVAQDVNEKLYQTFVIHVFTDRNDGIIDVAYLKEYYKKIKLVKSEMFKNIVFLSLNMDDMRPGNDSINIDNSVLFTCNYVIAYNEKQNRIYHLKGFKTNDFADFYRYEVDNFDKKKSIGLGELNDPDKFNSTGKIAGLDLHCLYRAIILKSKNGPKGCLISCVQRDKKQLITR